MTPEENKRYRELEKSITNAIRNTQSFKSDKNMQDKDKRRTESGYGSRLIGNVRPVSKDGRTGASHEREKYDKIYKDREEKYRRNRERDSQYGKRKRKDE